MAISTSSNFSRLAEEAHNLVAALNSLSSQYNSSLDSYNGKISGVSISNWNDEVASRMGILLEDLKGDFYQTLSTEITAGNFVTLINKCTELANLLDECNSWSNKIAELEPKYKAVNLKDDKDDSAIIAAYYNAKSSLDSTIKLANNVIKVIESLQFGGSSVPDTPAYVEMLNEVDANRDSWETRVGMTYQGDPFGYRYYGDVTIILHNGEVVMYRTWEGDALCYYDANHNPLSAKEASDLAVSHGGRAF